VPTDCSAVLQSLGTDYCAYVSGPCDVNNGGCQFGENNCTNVTHNLCQTVTQDKTYPGCCKIQNKTCLTTDPCNTYVCNMSTGNCDATPVCTPSTDACVSNTCNGTGCVVSHVQCTTTPCFNRICNSSSGLCDETPVSCDDLSACTNDWCDELATVPGCQHSDVVCANSTDPCISVLPCNPTTGTCPTQSNKCDDGIDCTDDVCVSGVGCVSTPNDVLCTNTDPCVTNSTCSVAAKGCINSATVCPGVGLYCLLSECIHYDGCSFKIRDCSTGTNISNSSCFSTNCSETNRTCTKHFLSCFNFLGIVAGIVVGAAIGGALGAAALLAAASLSGTAYAVSQTRNEDTDSDVKVNPLFKSQGKAAEGLVG